MFVKIALLSEGKLAIELLFVWALKWSLSCMDPKMVIEVMPLPETQSTAWVVTFEDLQMTESSWIFVLVDSEISCGRDMVFFAIFAAGFMYFVKICALDNFQALAVRGNLILNVLVSNLVPVNISSGLPFFCLLVDVLSFENVHSLLGPLLFFNNLF